MRSFLGNRLKGKKRIYEKILESGILVMKFYYGSFRRKVKIKGKK